MYVDVFGILAWTGLYLLGFMLLPIAIYRARRKWPWCLLLFVYLVGPLGWIGIHIAEDHTGKASEPRVAQWEGRRREDLTAFSRYCHAPRRVVHATAAPAPGDSLLLTIGPRFAGAGERYDAERLHEALLQRPETCAAIAVETIEGRFGTREAAGTPAGSVSRAFRLCRRGSWRKEEAGQARFELVLGESGEKIDLPDTGASMARSSVRLRDTVTGALLAEDSVHWFNGGSGVQDCPDAMERIVSLIADVFPRN